MFIFYFAYTNHEVLPICNENKEICVANLMIKSRVFPLRITNMESSTLHSEWFKDCHDDLASVYDIATSSSMLTHICVFFDTSKPLIFQLFLIRSIKAYLCSITINFDG